MKKSGSGKVKSATAVDSAQPANNVRLEKLYELSMMLSGDPLNVFARIARMIGELMDVRVVCLSEVRADKLFFVSVCVDGEVTTEAGSCALSVMPCATVENNRQIQIYDNVAEKFPHAAFLKQHNAYSYCGFPALDPEGNVVAVTCLLDDNPHDFTAHDKDMLRIFGQRIAAEIERKKHQSIRRQIEDITAALARSSSAMSGDRFYHDAVRSLAEFYNTRFAFIGLLNNDKKSVTTFVVLAGDRIVENFVYELEGTPCQDVMDLKREYVRRDVQQEYPGDQLLVDMGIESYFGAPLVSLSGEMLGLMAVMDTEPLEVEIWSKSILEVFASRIAVELERRQAEKNLRESREEFRTILDSIQDTVYRVDENGHLTMLSASIKRLLGYTPDELVGTYVGDLYLNHDDREVFLDTIASNGGEIEDYEILMKHKDGSLVWVSTSTHYLKDKDGNITGMEGSSRDVTDRRNSEERMRKLSSALQQTADSVIITDARGYIEYVNSAFEKITGYTREEVIGDKPKILSSGKHDKQFYDKLWGTILKGEAYTDILINKKKDGELYYEEKTITPLKDKGGEIINFISTGKDITERMKTQEHLQYLAHHDVLTRLPNRVLFTDRLDHALARTAWHNRTVALLFLDLDRFKLINDTLGHDVGDEALCSLSERLSACVREGDTVARIGGDEFAIILEDVSSDEDVAPTARKILEALSKPFELRGHEFVITTSIGISIYPNDGKDASTLLKNADIAMYRSKEEGRNTYQFYAADMSARAFKRLSMETSLRHALDREEYRLYYQPQVDAFSGMITGVEALLRWQHPELGLVSPMDFVPLLEDTGLIVPVGEWVLHAAVAQARAWQDAGHTPIRMAVNLSSRQFNSPGLGKHVAQVLDDSKLAAECFELEITESVIMDHSSKTVDTLQNLSRMGVRLAIDDFGTGYSSLAYLKRFPINTIKIDRSFIRDITTDPDDAAIVQAIIAMAKTLKLDIISEGVESIEQLEFVKAQQCRLIQGFLFSKPVPAAEVEKLFAIDMSSAAAH